MRIIHTSDWHLGQSFFTKNRAAEHREFLRWLVEQVTDNQVDALIVAGDIFDSGSPPSYARELYNRFVVDLQATRCQLVILGGNHDSVATLNESRRLFSHLNTSVIASVESSLSRQIILLKDRYGAPGALLCAVPFVRARDLVTSNAGESADKKNLTLQEAITRHYQELHQMALMRRSALNLPLPIITTGHLTTTGASLSDSVRELYIGTLKAFPASAFPPADYIALGHIHCAQQVASSAHIRYSGAPIPLSFDESDKDKSVFLVEFAQQSLHSVTPLTIPCWQPMQLIKGAISQIEQQLLTFNRYQGKLPVWLSIEVEAQSWLSDIQKHIQMLCAELPVEVILLRRSQRQRHSLQLQAKETLHELTINEVFERRLAQEPIIDQQRQIRLRQLFGQITEEVSHHGALLHENTQPASEEY